MKKTLIISALLASLSATVYGQGLLSIDASNNTSTSPTATTSGLVWIDEGWSTLNPALPTYLAQDDINLTIYAGSSAATLVPIGGNPNNGYAAPVSLTLLLGSGGSTEAAGDITFFGNGILQDQNQNQLAIPGAPAGGRVYVDIQAWIGRFNSYEAA